MLCKNEIRLDIGGSRDLYHFRSGDYSYSFGAELFTYTKLRGERDFHFPVDAVDYFFGVNFGVVRKGEKSDLGMRARISHISAHFVDGHYDGPNGIWRDSRNPQVYSREFIELLPFIATSETRIYLGGTYLFHVVPRDLGKIILQGGAEQNLSMLSFYGITPYAAIDLKLQKIGDYAVTKNAIIGFKMGDFFAPGLRIYAGYFDGMSIHGEYYNRPEKYFSWGFNIDI